MCLLANANAVRFRMQTIPFSTHDGLIISPVGEVSVIPIMAIFCFCFSTNPETTLYFFCQYFFSVKRYDTITIHHLTLEIQKETYFYSVVYTILNRI